jgi:WD40 repeat protein
VTLKGLTSQMIRANMGDHCVMRSRVVPVTVARLALGPRGRWLAVGANDGKVRLVSVRSGRTRKLAQKYKPMRYRFPRNPFTRRWPLRLRFTAGGRRLQLLQADSARLEWDVRTAKLMLHRQPRCGSPSASKRQPPRPRRRAPGLVTSRTRRQWARQRCLNVLGVDLSADGELLVTARGTVRRWRQRTKTGAHLAAGARPASAGKRQPDLPVKQARWVALDEQGARLAIARHYHGGELWELQPPRRLASLDHPDVQGQIADLSPDGRYVAIWIPKQIGKGPCQVAVWDLAARRRLGKLTATDANAARFTPDSRQLVVGTPGGLERWQLAPFERRRRLARKRGRVYGGSLAVAGPQIRGWGFADGRWRLWSRATARVRDFPEPKGFQGAALSPDGSRVALRTHSGVELWDTRTGKRIRSFASPAPRVVALSRKGRWLAVAGARVKTVRVLDTATGAERAHLPIKYRADALRFGRRGRELLVAGIGMLARWPFARGGALVPMKPPNQHLSVKALRLAAGGQRLIAFSMRHRAVSIWDLANGALLANLWPVQGGHWVARCAAGAADASARGRETLITLVRTPSSPTASRSASAGEAGAVRAARTARAAGAARRARAPRIDGPSSAVETVYGWELGWACFARPHLIPDAVAGRAARPRPRAGDHCR